MLHNALMPSALTIKAVQDTQRRFQSFLVSVRGELSLAN